MGAGEEDLFEGEVAAALGAAGGGEAGQVVAAEGAGDGGHAVGGEAAEAFVGGLAPEEDGGEHPGDRDGAAADEDGDRGRDLAVDAMK